MADDADRAQLEIEAEITQARLAAQAGSKLTPTGHCHNCEEQLDRRTIILQSSVWSRLRKARARTGDARRLNHVHLSAIAEKSARDGVCSPSHQTHLFNDNWIC